MIKDIVVNLSVTKGSGPRLPQAITRFRSPAA